LRTSKPQCINVESFDWVNLLSDCILKRKIFLSLKTIVVNDFVFDSNN
jgi:hypothetical protein